MDEPFYVRPPDFRYCLRTNSAYGWATGATEDGMQVLHCMRNWLLFDRDGRLVRAAEQELPFCDGPIEVLRFWLPECWMGIEDLPDELSEFFTAPDEYVMNPRDVEAWVGAGQFMFFSGSGDYIMGPAGRVEAS